MGSIHNNPVVVEDLGGILMLHSDGSIFRFKENKFNYPNHDDGTVSWNDHLFDEKHNLYLRLYKPPTPSSSSTTNIINLKIESDEPGLQAITLGPQNLPIVYFFHGGGFCLGSRTWPHYHNCCIRLSASLNAVVIAPDYRLAPENRLPAAVEDSLNSLKWLQNQASSSLKIEEFRDGCVDFDRVFIIGDSSGGNLAHKLAVRLGPGSLELAPVRVRGYVIMAPFFGGVERTKSEVEGPPEPVLNLEILDRLWRLSLPIGHNLDDPLANPFGPKSPCLESVSLDPILVMVGSNEVMKDRVHHYATKLKQLGKNIRFIEYEGKHHGFFTHDAFSEFADQVLKEIEGFICH